MGSCLQSSETVLNACWFSVRQVCEHPKGTPILLIRICMAPRHSNLSNWKPRHDVSIVDVRNLSESIDVLEGRMGAVRAIRFTSDGWFMAMVEPADFVHMFDTRSYYAAGHEIDLFGEIACISFSNPDADALFMAVFDRTYRSLLEFNRRSYNSYIGSIF